MHIWGDKEFDWDGLGDAMKYMHQHVRKYSRCLFICKEKYGTIRYEHIVPPFGHVMCRVGIINLPYFKKRTPFKNYPINLFCWNECWLYRKWVRFGYFILGRAIFKAVKKWPHLEHEIFQDAPEELVGEEIHGRYWRKL